MSIKACTFAFVFVAWAAILFLLDPLSAFSSTKTEENLVRVLVVAGHDDQHSGTSFGNFREADLTLRLGHHIASFLELDKRFEVITLRDVETGAYTDFFADYLSGAADGIQSFSQERLLWTIVEKQAGRFAPASNPSHGKAVSIVKFRLYGINRWVNENDVDLVVHVHFNDVPRRRNVIPKNPRGGAIYIPDPAYPSGDESLRIARITWGEINTLIATSTLGQEKDGIVPDPFLIATGSNFSLKVPSLLIEYGYIYEPFVKNKGVQDLFIREAAFRTARGINTAFMGPQRASDLELRSALLDYDFGKTLKTGDTHADVFALQVGLQVLGFYPPPGSTLRDCAVSGNYGSCTMRAVAAFQKEEKIEGVSGKAGTKTLDALEEKLKRFIE